MLHINLKKGTISRSGFRFDTDYPISRPNVYSLVDSAMLEDYSSKRNLAEAKTKEYKKKWKRLEASCDDYTEVNKAYNAYVKAYNAKVELNAKITMMVKAEYVGKAYLMARNATLQEKYIAANFWGNKYPELLITPEGFHDFYETAYKFQSETHDKEALSDEDKETLKKIKEYMLNTFNDVEGKKLQKISTSNARTFTQALYGAVRNVVTNGVHGTEITSLKEKEALKAFITWMCHWKGTSNGSLEGMKGGITISIENVYIGRDGQPHAYSDDYDDDDDEDAETDGGDDDEEEEENDYYDDEEEGAPETDE